MTGSQLLRSHTFRIVSTINRKIYVFSNLSRTTMDSVPWKFVDSVVDLFSKRTLQQLAQEVRRSLWKDVVDLHRRNRVYYRVDFRMEEGGIKHVFKNGTEVDLSINMRTIREKGRFARISLVSDSTTDRDLSYFNAHFDPFNRYIFNWDGVEPLGEAETAKLLETISPQIDPASCCFQSFTGSPDCTRVLLTSLFKRVYLQRITVLFCGQIAYDFLEDQINNSPFLSNVTISGKNWPTPTPDLLMKLCLKGRPGKLVGVCVYDGIHLDSNYIQNLFDLWKENGNLQFELFSFPHILDKKGLHALMSKGKLLRSAKRASWIRDEISFFEHGTEKSVAILSDDGCLIRCFTCECDTSKKCLFKERSPRLHKLQKNGMLVNDGLDF
uniref:F-box domain-containing protein n=1 Tax=Steinernema glaseri TaxID=37863 RepID=A0A1I7Y611_9BILA